MKILSSLAMITGLALMSLSQAHAQSNMGPCGLSGTVEERIQDCSPQASLTKEYFQLVSVTSEGVEVHLDKRTKSLWGSLIPKEMGYNDARLFCQNQFGRDLGFRDILWYLPQLVDYLGAKEDGIIKELADMNHVFLTVSAPLSSIGNYKSYGFSGKSGEVVYVDYEMETASVRCVGFKNFK